MKTDRLAKWEANPLPVKLPPSLQAAKDEAADALPTCGDCKCKVESLLMFLELTILPCLKGQTESALRSMIWDIHDAISFERKDAK